MTFASAPSHLSMLLALALGIGSPLVAQSVTDYTVQLSVSSTTNPPSIALSWIGDPRTSILELYRKSRTETSWGEAILLDAKATNYTDLSVTNGSAFEYRVSKWNRDYRGSGYIYAGIQLPLVESRGKLILLVDSSHAQSMAMELRRLQYDLVGDGWSVIRHDVSRTEKVTTIKSLIRSEYDADPGNVRSVLLFGHLPVPYSGNDNPDGHPEHKGAWPADSYYADIDGVWTDFSVTNNSASDPRNRNMPGDDKFDQSGVLTGVELELGRVDMANMPAFALTELELLRRYLNKDHAYRNKKFSVNQRGLVDDHLGVFLGEAYAACGWRNFATFFGSTNIFTGDWISTSRTQDFLWGYGCGAGTYSSAAGVATTAQLAAEDPKVVFTLYFGSYFGDWDTPDNFLRAPLATPTYTLTSGWAGRPYWMVHHMALGETIGSSTKVTQNNDWDLYAANGYVRTISTALMGDPTLRMHVVAPPSGLMIRTNDSGGLDLSWNSPPEPVLGYAIYRAASADGPFSRLNPELVEGTRFTVSEFAAADCYMVRAVNLQVSASGSYYNASQGIFQDLAGTFGPPSLTITRTSDRILLSWPANAMNYRLESSMAPVSQAWFPVTHAVTISNDDASVSLDSIGGSAFFRLQSR